MSLQPIQALQVYPHPARQKLFLAGLEGGSPWLVQVIDVLGHVVMTVPLLGPNSGLDVSALKPGSSIVQATMENEMRSAWFVK